jgi:hypothetical protein
MNGLKVEQFAEECRQFKAEGHEFSSECYEHEYSFMYTREQERESIQKTVAAFAKVLGQKPTGYLSPGHASTPHTLDLVAEAGFVWWADPLNSDNPYTVESGDKSRGGALQRAGLQRLLDLRRRANAQRLCLQIMKDQFDYLYWEGEQGAPKFLLSTCIRSCPASPIEPRSSTSLFATPRAFPKSGLRAASRSPTGAWRRATERPSTPRRALDTCQRGRDKSECEMRN